MRSVSGNAFDSAANAQFDRIPPRVQAASTVAFMHIISHGKLWVLLTIAIIICNSNVMYLIT